MKINCISTRLVLLCVSTIQFGAFTTPYSEGQYAGPGVAALIGMQFLPGIANEGGYCISQDSCNFEIAVVFNLNGTMTNYCGPHIDANSSDNI